MDEEENDPKNRSQQDAGYKEPFQPFLRDQQKQ
jgi:hypothetical protein